MRRESRKTGRRFRAGRGALIAIATFLIGSAIVRLGDDAGQAFARTTDEVDISKPAPGPAGECRTDEDLASMLDAFRQREKRLDAREAAVQDRMQALRVADREVERKLARLTEAEADLREMITMAETAAGDDLDRLTEVYENMKPKRAAALFEEMTPEFAAGFLGRMRPEAAAAIMAGLSPDAAHTFSVVLAGRNARVPRE